MRSISVHIASARTSAPTWRGSRWSQLSSSACSGSLRSTPSSRAAQAAALESMSSLFAACVVTTIAPISLFLKGRSHFGHKEFQGFGQMLFDRAFGDPHLRSDFALRTAVELPQLKRKPAFGRHAFQYCIQALEFFPST